MTRSTCAYCGEPASTDDHVIPRALYPASKRRSGVRWISVKACALCNRSWSDDEAHARLVLAVAGESNAAVSELWNGPIKRSFEQCDGPRRVSDLAAQLVPLDTDSGRRDAVYPGSDVRVMKVIRKMIRGLCHYHQLLSPVSDRQVWAEIQRFEVPPAFMEGAVEADAEPDICRYTYVLQPDSQIHSMWLLTFFERTQFWGFAFRSDQARAQFEIEFDRAAE